MLGAIVNNHVYNNSASRSRTGARSVDFLSFDQAPLATRSPVAVEITIRIFRVLLRMLLPGWIVHPDAVSGVVVLLLKRVEKMSDNVFLWPITKPPAKEENDHQDNDRRNDAPGAFARLFPDRIPERPKESCSSSITDTAEKVKVPGTIG